MSELCQLLCISKTRTTPYHPQGNGVVERNNKALGDSLRSLLLGQDQEQWDLFVTHIMRTFRATPHRTTLETPNYLMLGRDLRLPDALVHEVSPPTAQPVTEYVVQLQKNLEAAHDLLRGREKEVRVQDTEEPPVFAEGDTVWMVSKRRRKGDCHKLQPKFIGPYRVLEVYPNHTYKLECRGQLSVEHERRLKRHRPTVNGRGHAAVRPEPRRRPNMRGGTRDAQPAPAAPADSGLAPPVALTTPGDGCQPPQAPPTPAPRDSPMVTRSGRAVRAPARLDDFVTGGTRS